MTQAFPLRTARQYASPSMDALADLLAEGATIRECAERMGRPRTYVNALFQRMRKRLGKQAC